MSYRKKPRDVTRPTPTHRRPRDPIVRPRLPPERIAWWFEQVAAEARRRLEQRLAEEKLFREIEARWREEQRTAHRDSKWGSRNGRWA